MKYKFIFALSFAFGLFSCGNDVSLVGKWEIVETDSSTVHKSIQNFYEDNTWKERDSVILKNVHIISNVIYTEWDGTWSEKDDLFTIETKRGTLNGVSLPSEGLLLKSYKIVSKKRDKIECYEIHDDKKEIITMVRKE